MRDFADLRDLSPAERLQREIPLLGATDEEIRELFTRTARDAPAPEAYPHLTTYCTFIGYPRSGHSIMGSLLDAHPEAIIAHELDTFKFLEADFTAGQIYHLLLENSRLFTEHGRQWGRYSYAVPTQWQGRFTTLRVIGDNKGGRTTIRIAQQPGLLDRVAQVIPLQHRYIHVVRNPYDNIATLAMRQTKDLAKAVDQYFFMCRTNQQIQDRLQTSQILEIHHEDFVADPQGQLAGMCRFLGLEPAPDYLAACASIVYKLPHRSRLEVAWPAGLLRVVPREQARYPFLQRYGFDA
jgi:hypothetical protein